MVVDDERYVLNTCRDIFKDTYEVVLKQSANEALAYLPDNRVDLILLDIKMPEVDGMAMLDQLRMMDDPPPVVMVTANRDAKSAVAAMKLGAFDYITKPFDVDELRIVAEKAPENRTIANEVKSLRAKVEKRYGFENLVGESKPMQEIYRQIEQLADKRTSVLLLGESGTGKELVARAIHYHKESLRRDGPFVALDCNTLPESLFESELFGHEKGALKKKKKKIGRCELADKGTLFLDEIGEIPPAVQVKLLRFLQEHEFMRVGGTQNIAVDVRIIAATNRDLEKAVKDGKFREDLYYRINVVPIRIPPLRERSEDIPLLIDHFVKRISGELGTSSKTFAPEAVDLLMTYGWPGNVRELQNVVERLLVLSSDDAVAPDMLPESVREFKQDVGKFSQKVFSGELSLEEAERQFLTEIIGEALRRTNGVQTRAAELLKTSRRTLKYQMDKLGLS
ncbi:MAG: sigma-54-dependent Fis family transcriptional regulator [Candidatus Lindowbacteria bacterium]|nr:sigma-54-dependent Fis family transcriptional regulator [Candidatus Lindowbacteria bacterium]